MNSARTACRTFISLVAGAGLYVCLAAPIAYPVQGGALAGTATNWSPPANLAANPADAASVDAALDSQGRLHVVWSENGMLVHRWLHDGTWSDAAIVCPGEAPSLAAGGPGVMLLAFAANDDVHFSAWQDTLAWSEPVNVSGSASLSSLPSIAADADGKVAVTWSEQEDGWGLIYLAEVSPGEPWSVAPVPGAYGSRPDLALCGNGDLWLAWQDYLGQSIGTQVFVARRQGSQWLDAEVVSGNEGAQSILPALSCAGTTPVLAWQEGALAAEKIGATHWTGMTWVVPYVLSGTAAAYEPAVAVRPTGEVWFAWATAQGVQAVQGSLSTGSWSLLQPVATGQTDPTTVCLALGDTVHVLWLATAADGNRDVFYTTSVQAPGTATPMSPIATRTSTTAATSTWTRTLTPALTVTAAGTSTPTVTATPTGTADSPTPAATLTAFASGTATATAESPASPSATAITSGQIWIPILLR